MMIRLIRFIHSFIPLHIILLSSRQSRLVSINISWSGRRSGARRHFTARNFDATMTEAKMNVTVARSVLTSASRLVGGTAATASKAFSSTAAASSSDKTWKVYLSGEIHSDWREVIAKGVAEKNLPVSLSSPNTSHEDSDDCGAIILGMEEERRNWDKIGANMNNLRTKTLIRDADIVVVRFGPKYRQWNAAFDAGYASALGKEIITLHPPEISHMLKEVNSAASVVCEEASQVVDTLAYVINGDLPAPRDGDEFVPIADRLGAGNPNP